MPEARPRSPFAVRVGDRLQQIAIEAIVAAMVRDIIVDRFFRQVHERENLPFDPLARSECRERFVAPSAGLEVVHGAHLAEPSAENLHVPSELNIGAPLGVGHQLGQRSPHQLLLGPALDRLEARRNPRLGRKGCKKRLGEGVDRQDLESARTIQNAGEQLAGMLTGPRIVGHAKRKQVGGKLAVLEPDPGSEPSPDPVGHLRRGRLGEGQAENRFRPRSLKQQAKHPSGQNLRLPAPRRSGNRGVNLRVDGKRLLALQLGQRLEPSAHSASKAAPKAIDKEP
jgi:hypothetical protein